MKKMIRFSLSTLMAVQAISLGTSHSAFAGQLEDIRANLTSPLRPVVGLEKILATTEKEPRVPLSSSFFFKSLLKNVESDLLSFKKTGKAVVVDPNMTLEDLNAKIRVQEDHVCNQALNKLPGGIDSLLTTVMFRLVDSSAQEKTYTAEEKKVTTPAEQASLVALLRNHLMSAPKAAQDKNLLALMGEPQRIDFMVSRVRRINFSRKDGEKQKTLPLSFSMLSSYRSGRDEAFVKVQSCLVDYLKAQAQVFGERVGEMEQSATPVKSAMATFADMGLSQTKTSNIHFENMKPEMAKAYKLKHFLEGQQFSDVKLEKDFLVKRLAKISATMPYLQERLNGALEAHQLMSQMSKTQMDDLIGMFLQIMADDLPTPEKMAQLSAQAKTDAGKTEAFAEKYVYYKQLSEDLTNLDQALREEKMSNAATKQDLEEIRLKARP